MLFLKLSLLTMSSTYWVKWIHTPSLTQLDTVRSLHLLLAKYLQVCKPTMGFLSFHPHLQFQLHEVVVYYLFLKTFTKHYLITAQKKSMVYIQHHQVYIQSGNSQFYSLEMLPLSHMSHIYSMSTQLRLKKKYYLKTLRK